MRDWIPAVRGWQVLQEPESRRVWERLHGDVDLEWRVAILLALEQALELRLWVCLVLIRWEKQQGTHEQRWQPVQQNTEGGEEGVQGLNPSTVSDRHWLAVEQTAEAIGVKGAQVLQAPGGELDKEWSLVAAGGVLPAEQVRPGHWVLEGTLKVLLHIYRKQSIISFLLRCLTLFGHLLEPYLPTTSARIYFLLGLNQN